MILVTGASGFLGKRVCALLEMRKLAFVRTSYSLGVDLRDGVATQDLLQRVKPTVVVNCAAYVGGIEFQRKRPVALFTNNLRMQLNLFEACSP